MNSSDTSKRLTMSLPGLALMVIIISACGGGSSPAAVVTTQAPETSVAPASTTSAATGDLDTFCASSAEFWVAANMGNLIDLGDGAAVEAIFGEMRERLEPAIADAPDEENAAPVLQMQGHLDAITAALEGYDYDWIAWTESPDFAPAQDDVNGFVQIVEELEGFLNTQCTVDADALATASAALAAELTA